MDATLVDKWCSSIRGRLQNAVNFSCEICAGIHPRRADKVAIGDTSLECVGEFCYLDTNSARGDAEAASIAKVRSGWKEIKELLPILATRRTSLHLEGKIYEVCVRRLMLYDSETWTLKEEDNTGLNNLK